MFLTLAILISLFTSSENTADHAIELNGGWALIQTELYKNGDLVGSASPTTPTTHYYFASCPDNMHKCQLTISEDGENSTYNYTYSPTEGDLTLDGTSHYKIEVLSHNELVFYKDYNPHRSRYSFQKIK